MTTLRTQESQPTCTFKWLFEHMMMIIIIRIPLLHVAMYTERKIFYVSHCKQLGGNCGEIMIVSSL